MKVTAFAATMQAVWFSHDLGETWNRPKTPSGGFYNEARCWSVVSHPQRPGEFLAGTDQGLYRWLHETQCWNYIPSPMDDLHIQQLARSPDDPSFIVCGTRPGEIFKSEDDGITWQRCNLDAATECWFINTTRVTSIQFDPDDRDTIWITIEIDGVFRSKDRGETWESLSAGLRDVDTHNLVFFGQPGERTIFCATEAGLHKSTNEGQTWEFCPTPESPWPYLRCLETKKDGSGIMFASVGQLPSGDVGMLLRSMDKGETWEKSPVPEPINSTIWWIGTNPVDPNLIFLCTIFGQIFRSQDGGESWIKMKRELGEVRMIGWAPTPE
ncbi:MAG: hypothetical protein GKR93_17675 [Gammaproteobacteria bacterium]|nr:hypothetical protein [Gammaproteobacteria bacterium]